MQSDFLQNWNDSNFLLEGNRFIFLIKTFKFRFNFQIVYKSEANAVKLFLSVIYEFS